MVVSKAGVVQLLLRAYDEEPVVASGGSLEEEAGTFTGLPVPLGPESVVKVIKLPPNRL